MTTHNFASQLEYSLLKGEDIFFDMFYHRTFPNLLSVRFVENLPTQKKGIDKILTFNNGIEVWVDEKKRKKDYGDILLEIWSVWEQKKLGWLYTSQSDYIVYAVMTNMKVYLLPTFLLRQAWITNKDSWLKTYKWIDAKNVGYTTKSKAIPVNILLPAIAKEMEQNLVFE